MFLTLHLLFFLNISAADFIFLHVLAADFILFLQTSVRSVLSRSFNVITENVLTHHSLQTSVRSVLSRSFNVITENVLTHHSSVTPMLTA